MNFINNIYEDDNDDNDDNDDDCNDFAVAVEIVVIKHDNDDE